MPIEQSEDIAKAICSDKFDPATGIVSPSLFKGAGSSVIEVFVSLMRGGINLNFGVLGIFIGIGLLRLRRGWRTCALVFTWIALILAPIIGFVFASHPGPLDLSVFGQKVGHASKEMGLAVVLALFIYSIWQYRVLTRRDVRQLFADRDESTGRRMEVHSALFEEFLRLHPEFRSAEPRLQWGAFHKWLNRPPREE